ncbi:hypothetical protein Y886_12005 [Xanthomonas hyacinthi DSM 19077]|nr:hypothetical protein Y886_12005 [Xanthomonas hyacinthi DSM 19077]
MVQWHRLQGIQDLSQYATVRPAARTGVNGVPRAVFGREFLPGTSGFHDVQHCLEYEAAGKFDIASFLRQEVRNQEEFLIAKPTGREFSVHL